jgi:phenylacetate-CoA ligase
MLCFSRGMRFREAAAEWAPEEKREWVLERLRFSVRRAAQDTVHYRALFKSLGFDPESDFTFEDFSLLPVLEREDIHQAGTNLLSTTVAAKQLQRDSTGGSTGAPTEVWLGPEERGWRESGIETFMRRINVPTGTRTALLWGHHLDPAAGDSLRERWAAFKSHVHQFDCFRLSPSALDQYHHRLERWRPTCMIAYASALGHLAEHILERGYRPSYPTRCFVTGAEKLLPRHREAIEEAFKRPVYERYGARDVGGLGFQLVPGPTCDYEVDWANVLIEPETANVESAILVTKLHGDGMPMLRYRIGDIGRFPGESRPGHPTFVLHEVLGRDVDRVWLPDGGWISALQVPHMMKDYPVHEFMLIQHADYSIELKIVPRSGFRDDMRAAIRDMLRLNLPAVDVAVVLVQDIPRTRANKWRPIVSEIKQSRGKVAV